MMVQVFKSITSQSNISLKLWVINIEIFGSAYKNLIDDLILSDLSKYSDVGTGYFSLVFT